jgi:hypothetical protein
VTRVLALLVALAALLPLADDATRASGIAPVSVAAAGAAQDHDEVDADDDDDDDDDDEAAGAEVEDHEKSSGTARARARAGVRVERLAAVAAADQKAADAPVDQSADAPVDQSADAPVDQSAGSGAVASESAPVPAAAPAVAAATVGGTGGALSWAPPAGYTGYPVKNVSAASALTVIDGRGGDVLVKLPAHSVGPVTITNCRNAVLIGGRITVLPSATVGGADQRGIYVRNCTGTVHIEGVHIEGNVAGSQADGIAVNAPRALVQIQNVRVDGMRGGMSGNHADVFQPWGGVREFRIDRLTGSTNYQGLHIFENLGAIGAGTIRNTNIASSEVGPVDKGGYFLWMDCSDGFPLAMDNVYVAGREGRSLGQSVWPPTSHSGCPAQIAGGLATWPGNRGLSGGVREGRPASGDFVPLGSVGLSYVSPGYR